MLRRMGAAELVMWRAFERLEPWGTEIEDWRAAIGPAQMTQLHVGEKKRIDVRKFYPPYLKPVRRRGVSLAEIDAALGGFFDD